MKKILRPAKTMIRRIVDRLQCRNCGELEMLGTESTWSIIPDLLPKAARVLSGGVGNDISFEFALMEKYNAQVAAFDPSPTAEVTIAKLFPLPPNLQFFPKGLAGKTEIVGFAKPRIAEEGSWRRLPGATDNSFECLDYTAALALAGWDSCDLLKIDIEGFEYDFIASIDANTNRPSQIAVETHEFLPGHTRQDTRILRERLGRLGYVLAWKRRHDHLFVRK